MTSLKKLSESLNLKTLNTFEASNLKGGKNKKLPPDLTPPKPKLPIGGGGLPPTLDTETIIIF